MIRKITLEQLHRIPNKTFTKYAHMYIDREAATLEHIESFGVPLAAEQSEEIKDEKIKQLADKGALVRNNEKSIVSNKKISSACIACKTGTGSYTTYTSLKCHRNCYFCFNPNQEDYVMYKDAKKDIIAELQGVLDTGVELKHLALTGGEPLLYKEEMYEFFAFANEKTPQTHTRLYTTGDLFDEETLIKLKELKLDEIRFSIKMDDSENKIAHTLKQIALAQQYIPDILVEMPVIPGTLKEMKELLLKLDELGIFGINLLELCFPLGNAEAFTKRGFSLKNPPYEMLYNYWYAGGLAVAGSEEESLELVQYALEKDLKLGVHYCSLENKHTGQIYQQNHKEKLDETFVFSDKDYFFKTTKAFGKDRKVVQPILEKNKVTYVENNDYDFIQFPVAAIGLLKHKNIDLGISSNVVEEEQGETLIREVGIEWTTPDLFEIEDIG